ncbi:5-oxoprolinase subunit B family protein [Corynebacterium pelargi]|uniref:Kinase A inhibitor n=1 Tax=Corynebacterium pelargi TaxID=1471400 RepID=A0A410WB10_9CORY|nr:carboxyltransferase domain-containing protein [Corynebacterium pelargi]QAU53116.1 Kinase A inhibitor [Corynebacterium pelargi]GGG74790.1 allophanate hydrolase [Corynebacterium pelargi]
MSDPHNITMESLGEARITFGGDEFVFVEVSDEMSLAANFRVTAIARKVAEARQAGQLEGVIDICPANASLLLRIDPELMHPFTLERRIREFEREAADEGGRVHTRIIEVPVWYSDPYTSEVVARFREGYHQDPSGTDLDYAAAINDLDNAEAFIRAHHESPWLVTMVGFVAGLPFMFQLVDRDEQLEVPKYLSPRTDTPALTVGHGGCFACIYSVRGAGGYQMFGIAAAPIYDPEQHLPDFENFMILFRPGDIVKFKPVEEEEYRRIQQDVDAGTYTYRMKDVSFDISEALADRHKLNERLIGVLYAD